MEYVKLSQNIKESSWDSEIIKNYYVLIDEMLALSVGPQKNQNHCSNRIRK